VPWFIRLEAPSVPEVTVRDAPLVMTTVRLVAVLTVTTGKLLTVEGMLTIEEVVGTADPLQLPAVPQSVPVFPVQV
jgi:hypothetical protein